MKNPEFEQISVEVSTEKQVIPILNYLTEKFPERYSKTKVGSVTLYSDLRSVTLFLERYLKRDFGICSIGVIRNEDLKKWFGYMKIKNPKEIVNAVV